MPVTKRERAPMNVFARPGLAIGFAAFFMCADTCLHFENIVSFGWDSMPLNDWVVSLLLIWGAVKSRANRMDGRTYQAVGWAFNAT